MCVCVFVEEVSIQTAVECCGDPENSSGVEEGGGWQGERERRERGTEAEQLIPYRGAGDSTWRGGGDTKPPVPDSEQDSTSERAEW